MTGVLASLGLDPMRLLASVGSIGLLAVVFAESGIMVGFFLPGDSLLFTAGLLSATTGLLWPFPVLVVGCAVAAIAGDQVGYTFGHRVGPSLFRRPDSRLFKQEHLERAEAFFERHGSKTIILARFVPVVRTFAPIVAGASRMNHRTFTVYNVIGGTAWATSLLGLGYVLGARVPSMGDYLDVAVVVIIVVSLVPIGIEYLRHRRATARLATAGSVPVPSTAALSALLAEGAAPDAAAVVEDRPTGGRRRRWRRWRRPLGIAAVVMAVLLLFPGASFVSALRAPGSSSTTEKAVEWMRDHGMSPVVNRVESWWYSNHAPPTGGVPDRTIPTADPVSTGSDPTVTTAPVIDHTARPVDVVSPVATPLPNEGVWQPAGPVVDGVPTMYTTQVRPDPTHTSLLAGLAWMDPKLLRFELHPGLQEPGGRWATPTQIPGDERVALVAAFNGGFRMQDANGGFYLEGREQHPLRDGAASLVITADGRATVGEWGRDVAMSPDVVAVRQNLKLIVDGGQPVAGLDNNANGAWGATLGNKVLVWRSAVCVDPAGGLVFGYGDGLGALSLAQLMQRAGCVRAMELDINQSWTTFNTYAGATLAAPTSVQGTKLLPDQHKGGDRYLSDDTRDFVAVLKRR